MLVMLVRAVLSFGNAKRWKKEVDSGNIFGALLKSLSKIFDCIPHDFNNRKIIFLHLS